MKTNRIRSKWAAIGAAIAVSLGAGGIGIGHATTTSGERPIYLPIEPCRLADTRPAFNVGPRATPLGAAETYDIAGWGSVGNCTLPSDTAGLALNVTAIDPSAPTFLTLFPDGTTLPLASHLNPTPGQPPTPNAVNVDLSAAGMFSIYNLAGNVHIAIDVVGIYDDHNHDDRYYTETESDDRYLAASQDSHGAIAEENDTNINLTATDTVIISADVDTPASGFVMAQATLRITDQGAGTAGFVRCSLVQDTLLDFDAVVIETDFEPSEGKAVTLTRGFAVDKSAPPISDEMTVNLVCDNSSDTTETGDVTMTLTFIPDPDAFGGIVAVGADADSALDGSEGDS